MEYNWSNPSWKRIEVKSKQEDYQSKLAGDKHNFNHGDCNRFNAYGVNNHGNGNFTSRRHVGAEYSKEKENELEKRERVNENGCFNEKQESEREAQREKEIVVLQKSGEVNFCTNDTNSFFAKFFDRMVSKEKCRPSWNVENFITIGEKRCFYAKESEFIEDIGKDELVSLLYCKEKLSGLSLLREINIKLNG
ncbi:hypothetical protein M9H77_13231 [Catharanthus roseus]|uniref:Uncharacterized protein n=1 Tax=Catharanthus roseus TaxID=4058 RepID=A0ACC0BJU2_CATRO|nr:hypothetical protein M9H77_13231 [Catharanthus roseus]